ncbi:nuclear transport factor 2 family protein [Streptomyces sp. SA15]|uniref:nuclear transport factor 2 family protein n=1 Tax=Streptomyces sp. SA15 TaxID=934019 RepID=UPI0015C77AF1|nr:nuclear transport factor 2 family protein [Streptomyces sp. SA15]
MTNIDVVRSIYDAFGRKDIDGLMGLLDPTVEIYQTDQLPWGGRYRGLEGAQEFLGKLVSHIDSAVEPEELVEAGERVVEIGRSRGLVKGTGREFDVREVHVWELRNDKVVSFQSHIDTPEMLRVLE